ncbi:uncharacterized protein BT62DRAFT_623458 [Guyanagaster necrorhizus]|uniref:Uncharacterized protein n=1 Tax=Guyanagaster necrorhizus TaxID=856835 RepID=A0A9P7W0R0_9AGAR|nr:uncharacterized protein BT62DRAFT_623458 [Guyanagaster necrorhizus MCA 3950]KAG7450098.1 hypothetical protein BT62DRAFT_623458 [Guyanagaster necrorhizus MCA 3950]
MAHSLITSSLLACSLDHVRSITEALPRVTECGINVIFPFLLCIVYPFSSSHWTISLVKVLQFRMVPCAQSRWWMFQSPVIVTGTPVGMFRSRSRHPRQSRERSGSLYMLMKTYLFSPHDMSSICTSR